MTKFPRSKYSPKLYILRDGKALAVGDVIRWAEWWENNVSARTVAHTIFKNIKPWLVSDYRREREHEKRRIEMFPGHGRASVVDMRFHISRILVSTVFLGLDHSFGGGPPLIFESMIFNGPLHDEMDRYTTWEQAQAGHKSYVAKVKAALDQQHRKEKEEANAKVKTRQLIGNR